MSNEILKCGSFMLFFGSLTRKHFHLSPVWCEYYQPSELDDVGVPKEWIEFNLLNPLEEFGDRAYYASTDKIAYSKREFLNVFCDLELSGQRFEGYLYLVRGVVNSVCVFLGEDVVDFYSSDILTEDNAEALKKISHFSGLDMRGVVSLKYLIKSRLVDFLGSEGKFNFPIE